MLVGPQSSRCPLVARERTFPWIISNGRRDVVIRVSVRSIEVPTIHSLLSQKSKPIDEKIAFLIMTSGVWRSLPSMCHVSVWQGWSGAKSNELVMFLSAKVESPKSLLGSGHLGHRVTFDCLLQGSSEVHSLVPEDSKQ